VCEGDYLIYSAERSPKLGDLVLVHGETGISINQLSQKEAVPMLFDPKVEQRQDRPFSEVSILGVYVGLVRIKT